MSSAHFAAAGALLTDTFALRRTYANVHVRDVAVVQAAARASSGRIGISQSILAYGDVPAKAAFTGSIARELIVLKARSRATR